MLQSQLGENYMVALNLVSSSPAGFPAIGALPMYLGLDLRGGVHFLLAGRHEGARSNKPLDRYKNDFRTELREEKIRYAGITREGQAVACSSAMPRSRQKAHATNCRTTSPDLR